MNSGSRTKIISNTIPEHYHGVSLFDKFGMSIGASPFTSVNEDVRVNIIIFVLVFKTSTKQQLFEFKTSSLFSFKFIESKEELYLHAFGLIQTAIGDFNGYLKANKSTVTMFKSYPEVTYKSLVASIRQAFANPKLN